VTKTHPWYTRPSVPTTQTRKQQSPNKKNNNIPTNPNFPTPAD
jgi:hypothetical protein